MDDFPGRSPFNAKSSSRDGPFITKAAQDAIGAIRTNPPAEDHEGRGANSEYGVHDAVVRAMSDACTAVPGPHCSLFAYLRSLLATVVGT